ncbi:MAG: phosphodiester glycosidase family protein [Christensenellales bacterium]
MRRTGGLFLALALLAICLPGQAQGFPDLRGFAPPGTFLEEGEAPLVGADSYRSSRIAITLTKRRVLDSDVYLADIRLAAIDRLRRALAHDAWGAGTEKLGDIATRSGALLALTGDNARLLGKGLVVANGEVLRSSSNALRDNCLVGRDGTMACLVRGQMDLTAALGTDIWQSFLFGPSLLLPDGSPCQKFSSDVAVANPRSVIGWYEPGHFCFLLVEGRRKHQRGLTLAELARLMAELGCRSAYNLDGGQSAMLWFKGALVNSPYKGGRPLTDIVIIKE